MMGWGFGVQGVAEKVIALFGFQFLQFFSGFWESFVVYFDQLSGACSWSKYTTAHLGVFGVGIFSLLENEIL